MRRVAGAGLGLVLVLSYLTACLAPQSGNFAPSANTPRPMPVLATATLTPQPLHTATATAQPDIDVTSAPKTETSTPQASVTPSATATPLPTLAANVCPLTGLSLSDPSVLDRRPLAIKIQNAALSRPQYGLPQADIVYEHLTEAAITRFTAIYLCQNPARVGSTRSARYIDLELPVMYKSILIFSGTSPGLAPKFQSADFVDREFVQNWGWHAEAFFRDAELRRQGVPIEHTLFVDAQKAWEIASDLGLNDRQDLRGMTFETKPPAGGQPATHIHIPFPSRDMVVDWRYDAHRGKYLRWVEGEPHVDAATGEQLTADNVVVVYVTHADDMAIFEDTAGKHPSVQIQLWGTGPAVVFRDGQAAEGLWARPKRDSMLLFRDPAGQVPVPLKPGNTWIELVPLPGHRWSFKATWDTLE